MLIRWHEEFALVVLEYGPERYYFQPWWCRALLHLHWLSVPVSLVSLVLRGYSLGDAHTWQLVLAIVDVRMARYIDGRELADEFPICAKLAP